MVAKWHIKIVIMISLTVLLVLVVTACGKKQETAPAEQAPAQETVTSEQVPAQETAPAEQMPEQETSSAEQMPEQETASAEQAPEQETEPAKKEQVPASGDLVEQAENEVQDSADDAGNDAVPRENAGEMDLTGSWDDEVSQRASMEVARKDDGSYEIRVHWGSSATETAVWEIHGTYDEAAGMLSYEDGEFTIHTWEDQNKETISGKEITKGAFMKEGSKLRWSDSQNSEDCVFVKAE